MAHGAGERAHHYRPPGAAETFSRVEGERVRRIAVVTPIFEDWACFCTLVREISERFTGADLEFHVYAIDDGSCAPTDLASLSLPPDSCILAIEVVRLALNLGHQRAIAVGLSAIAERPSFEAVLVMDCDGEDRPADIAALLSSSRHHPGHIILAQRAKRSESRGFRVCYALYKRLFRILTGHAISFGNYSLIPMPAVRRLVHMPELWNNLAASIIRSRIPYLAVPTARGARYAGRSRMNLVSLVVHGLSAMSVHSEAVFVRLLLAAGMVAGLAAAGILAVTAVRFGTDLGVPGWATTAVGDMLIILLQSFVIIVAATLTMLAGRSHRPILPLLDARQFIAGREQWQAAPAAFDPVRSRPAA